MTQTLAQTNGTGTSKDRMRERNFHATCNLYIHSYWSMTNKKKFSKILVLVLKIPDISSMKFGSIFHCVLRVSVYLSWGHI